jgi:hypothetical protein
LQKSSDAQRFPWSKQMTTRVPGQYPVQQTRGAPSLIERQSKDDALLRTWFPNLSEDARDFFSTQWSKTGLPLAGNYEAAKKLHDQLFRRGAKPVRPRSLSATPRSGSGKSLTERAVHVPSTQAPAPAPDPEIYIDLTDFLTSTATEAKTEEAPASIDATSGMLPEDEALCEELDKALEDWTGALEIAKFASRLDDTSGFREEFTAHCQRLRQIHKKRLKGAENQNALLRERVTAHVSNFLSVAGQSENFVDLEIVATAAKELADYYPDAAPSVDLGRRLAETFRQLMARSDGSGRGMFRRDLMQILTRAIVASDVSSVRALLTTAFQYCDVMDMQVLSESLKKVDKTRHSYDRWAECLEKSLEQTAQMIRNLSMRGSDQEAVQLLRTAVWNANILRPSMPRPRIEGRVLEAYQALSRRGKYLALQTSELKRGLSAILKEALPSTEEADAAQKEIEAFDSNLFALPEVSSGGDILTIIKKLEEAFAQLPEPLAANVAALLHSHIQEFLDSASTSSETPDDRGARREILPGALNYAFIIKGAIVSLAGLLSGDEAFTARSWFGWDPRNPIVEALDNRLEALGARNQDW